MNNHNRHLSVAKVEIHRIGSAREDRLGVGLKGRFEAKLITNLQVNQIFSDLDNCGFHTIPARFVSIEKRLHRMLLIIKDDRIDKVRVFESTHLFAQYWTRIQNMPTGPGVSRGLI